MAVDQHSSSIQYKDLLQLIINAAKEGENVGEPSAAKGCPVVLTEEGIANITMDILLAGFDTTANSLCFVSYLLAMHPEIQGKLQKEIVSYFEENPVRLQEGFLKDTLPNKFSFLGSFSLRCSL